MNNLSNNDDAVECPLCMEPLEVDDLNFFPCTCGYQICRFCWHRIRTDENELCPACRKEYPENPADFKPLTQEEMIAFKSQKKQRDQQRKHKITENRKHLANVRVVQKNLVFVVGLPPRLADADILKKHEYFGKYGKIHKVVINPSTAYAGVQGPSASAYVTYVHNTDALRAIQSVNNIMIDGRLIKTSLGTTKYCSHFMRNQQCPKADCMYLHDLGDPEASFTKEEMHQGKHQEYEKRLHDVLIASSTGYGVSAGAQSTLAIANSSKNLESCKVTSSTASTNSTSGVTAKNLSSTTVSPPQKEAWPSLSISPVNQKDSFINSGNKNKKERAKQDKNKNDKTNKAKNNRHITNMTNLNTSPKEVDLSVVSDGLSTNNCQNEHLSKPNLESDQNQCSLIVRANSKKDLGTSTITENEIEMFGNNSKETSTTAHNLDNSRGYVAKKIRNDDITKLDSHCSISSSSNINTSSENNSLISEILSGKSSPDNFNDKDEHSNPSDTCKHPLSPSSELDNKTECNKERIYISENCSKSHGYKENIFGKSEYIEPKITKESKNSIMEKTTDNNKVNYNELVLKDIEGNNSITDNMSKLDLFDKDSFFSSSTGLLQPSMHILHNDEIIPNPANICTAPNLPDLINGIDGYQNTTNEWEEALKNVVLRSNKQMEGKFQQNLQQIQNQSHLNHQEDLQRLHEIQKRNNVLSSLSASQLIGSTNDFQPNFNSYLTGSGLSRQPSYLQYQQLNESSNDNIVQDSLFGANMSKFFDFHKHQQQQKLQHLQIGAPNNVNAIVNENLHMMPVVENNRINPQLINSSCALSTQHLHQKQKLFGKMDSVLCHQTPQHVPSQQISSLSQQNHYGQSSNCDDDLGFDPFIETQKVLAELIENEKEQNVATSSSELLNHKQVNTINQPHQQHMMEYMQRARMPPPGFSHVNNFTGYGVVPRIQNSKALALMNFPNNCGISGQHIQQQQQIQVPSNTWGTHLGNYQQHINEQQIRQLNLNLMQNDNNQKGYTGNDWTAMDPAILSSRQFSFPHQTQAATQMQSQQQEMFLQQLVQQQQQAGFTSQSQQLSGGNIGMPNNIMNSQQGPQTHVNANVQGMLEYLKTHQFS